MKCTKCGKDYEIYNKNGLKIPYCPETKEVFLKFPVLKTMSEKMDVKTEVLNPS